MPGVQHVGQIETLEGLELNFCQAGNKLFVSNGHARPKVTDGFYWAEAGVEAPLRAPTIVNILGSGAGNVTGIWRFFTQFWQKERAVPSNLSPASAPTDRLAGRKIILTLNTDNPFLLRYLGLDQRDLVAIWAWNIDTGDIKMVGRVSAADSQYTFDMTMDEFNAIVAEDRVVKPIGSMDQRVSIGHDILPAALYQAYYQCRWFGLGQADYTHPGGIMCVPTEYFSTYVDALYGVGAVDANWSGALRAAVMLAPYPLDPIDGKFWAHSEGTYVGVAPNRSGLYFMINGNCVARIGADGKIYLAGKLRPSSLVVNGTFDYLDPQNVQNPLRGWFNAASELPPVGWKMAPEGRALHAGVAIGGPTDAIEQHDIGVLPTRTYRVTYKVYAHVTGTVRVYLGTTAGTLRVATGGPVDTYTENIIAAGAIGNWIDNPTTAADRIAFQPSGDFDGAIDDVSVTPVPTAYIGGSGISYDAALDAILVKSPNVANWRGAMIFHANGDLSFDDAVTVVTSTAMNAVDATDPNCHDPVSWYQGPWPYVDICFLPEYTSYGALQTKQMYYYDATGSTLRTWGIVEYATTSQLSGYPLFQKGLQYKPFYVRGEFVGTVYSVMSPTLLFLDSDIPRLIGNPSAWEYDWNIEGLKNHLFYSRFGYTEGGYYGESVRQEGKGSYLVFDEGKTPVGLRVTPFGLLVMFREVTYLVRITGTETPLVDVEITRVPNRITCHASRSIASTRDGDVMYLTAKPKGIGISRGPSTEIITDKMFNRRFFGSDVHVEQSTLSKATATMLSNEYGERYLLANMDRAGKSGGKFGAVVDMRENAHLVELENMPMSAVASVQLTDDNEIAVYGDQNGKVGYLFTDARDDGNIQRWMYRIYFSPKDLQLCTITGIRVFAMADANRPYTITATIYGVGNLDPDELHGHLHDYEKCIIIFDQDNCKGETFLSPSAIATSAAFVIELEGKQDFPIRVKRLDVQWEPSGAVLS